ncbi:MAG TPA: hypothetical protein VGN79_02250 [Devosia sp.]|jgi:hypothetical protein|nr:hypothetical protein [Devosia sp.]
MRALLAGVGLAAGLICSSAALANGLGEARPYQFRTDSQRQVNLTVERTRLELDGLLGSSGSAAGLGGGTGQTGNQSAITVSGSNNNITITQTNNGAQTQTSDCSDTSFNITGGMYGC